MSPTSVGKAPSTDNPPATRAAVVCALRRGPPPSATKQFREQTAKRSLFPEILPSSKNSEQLEVVKHGQLNKTFKPNPFPPGLPQPKQLAAWYDWKKQFELSMCLAGKLSQQEKASCLFLSIGDEMREIISTHEMMPSEESPGYEHCKELMSKLDAYFRGSADDTFDLNTFFGMKQERDESAQKFETRVLRQARVCGLHHDARVVRAAYVKGMKDVQTSKLANANDWDMVQIVKAAARSEAYEAATGDKDPWKAVIQPSEEVCAVNSAARQDFQQPRGRVRFQRYERQRTNNRPRNFAGTGNRWNNRNPTRFTSNKGSDRNCPKCGLSSHRDGTCPAIGKNCIRCGKPGHFQFVCQASVNVVDDREEVQEEVDVYA